MCLFELLTSLSSCLKLRSNHENNHNNDSIIPLLDDNQNQNLTSTSDPLHDQQAELVDNMNTAQEQEPIQNQEPSINNDDKDSIILPLDGKQNQNLITPDTLQDQQPDRLVDNMHTTQESKTESDPLLKNQEPPVDNGSEIIRSMLKLSQTQEQTNQFIIELGTFFLQHHKEFMCRGYNVDENITGELEELPLLQANMKQTTSEVNAEEDSGNTTTKEESSSTKLKEVDAILSGIVGLEGVKLQLRKWAKGLILSEKRKTLGLKVGSRKALHMALLGNPGTGKTMVARILGKILHRLGLISTNKVIEVQRTDLVAEYIGQTAVKTQRKIKEANGGILFVDEAYRLTPPDTPNDFGFEALEEIMSEMDSGNIVAVFAGYSKDMQRVILANEGFSRRVSKFFHFDDYSPRDIALILQSKISTQEEDNFVHGFKLHPDCTLEAMAQLIKENTSQELRKAMNGGLVDPWLVNTLESMDLRMDPDCTDNDTLITIKMEDLEDGLKSLTILTEETNDRYKQMYL